MKITHRYLTLLSLGLLLASPWANASFGLKDVYPLASQTSLPESVAFDPVTQSLFATAFIGGEITRVDAFFGRAESVFYKETTNPNMTFFGAKVDPIRRVLWVCGADLRTAPTAPSSAVYAIRIPLWSGQGKLIRKIPIAGVSICNDLALDAAGNAYATDSAQPNVYKVSLSAPSASIFATSPLFAPAAPGAIGLNGIAITPNQKRLLVGKSIPSVVFSVSTSDPADILPVTTSGQPFPDPVNPLRMPGLDGIAFFGGKLYVVYNGAIQQLTFTNAAYSAAVVKSNINLPTGLSAATEADGRLYTIKSEIFPVTNLGLPPELPFRILRVDLGDFH